MGRCRGDSGRRQWVFQLITKLSARPVYEPLTKLPWLGVPTQTVLEYGKEA